jgi:DnaJ-class molecular chaperone
MKEIRLSLTCPSCKGEGGYMDGEGDEFYPTNCTTCGGDGWVSRTIETYRITDLINNLIMEDNDEAVSLVYE